MAAIVSLSFSLDPQQYHHHHCHIFSFTHHFKPHQNLPLTPSTSSTILPKYPLSTFPKSDRFAFKSFSSPSHSPTTTAVDSTTTNSTTTTTDSDTTTSTTSSFLEYLLRTGKFLSSEELEQLKLLRDFRYYQELESGSMWVLVMRPEELEITIGLLTETFVESMLLPPMPRWRQMGRSMPLSILGWPGDQLGLGASLSAGLEWISWVLGQ